MCAPPFVTKQCPPIWKILDPPLYRAAFGGQAEWGGAWAPMLNLLSPPPLEFLQVLWV